MKPFFFVLEIIFKGVLALLPGAQDLAAIKRTFFRKDHQDRVVKTIQVPVSSDGIKKRDALVLNGLRLTDKPTGKEI
jgi:hypothetical protein